MGRKTDSECEIRKKNIQKQRYGHLWAVAGRGENVEGNLSVFFKKNTLNYGFRVRDFIEILRAPTEFHTRSIISTIITATL